MWPFDRKKKLVLSFGRDVTHTPDLPEVQDSMFKLLFVHDDMLPGHVNQGVLKGISQKVSRGFTQDSFDYRVGRFTGKAVPFLDPNGLKVKGQLHAVKSQHIPELDKRYKNGVEFFRLKVNVIVVNRDHIPMSIGNEAFLKQLPPGTVHTKPGLGIREYISDHARVCLVQSYMYVAMKSHWNEDDHTILQTPHPEFPKQPLVWLPKYYRYPINRNVCLK